ncbi:hypothetical protein NBT05_00220 [Aquimarina sp. ERC-38]|uniref:hypothetical protein n=1 Tax=Aquimarina sp. ERC-38 TaxID=2949996 RepID=UPI0022463D87|nr:hypothetical protein [Aquimarina sp. ERC-38]UZO80927.1 hypothetical protein NBT05_00220 [Aquimarina sp. ERC-38]
MTDTISRSFISDYEQLDNTGKEHPNIYLLGDLIRDAVILTTEIEKTDAQVSRYDRIRQGLRTNLCSTQIYNKCKHLEKSCRSGKDYLKLLRKELLTFNKLQKRWIRFL